jgi:hypothetical protein
MSTSLLWASDLPFGIKQLKRDAATRYKPRASDPLIGDDWIACCIKGCEEHLGKRKRGQKDDYCSRHSISISSSPAYVYKQLTDNLIVGREAYRQITEKVDPRRLNSESSEDSVSWNVFVSLLAIGGLGAVYKNITGVYPSEEPHLYLWGNRIGSGRPEFWDLLRREQHALEPDKVIRTEPDIILHLPGEALIFIEAKFGSPNSLFEKKEKRVGPISTYFLPYKPLVGKRDPLNRKWLCGQTVGVLEQLCRNAVLGQRLAKDPEQFYLVNLVRDGQEIDVEERLAQHLTPETVKPRRITWEQLYSLIPKKSADGAILRQYMENKTLHLRKAFDPSLVPTP